MAIYAFLHNMLPMNSQPRHEWYPVLPLLGCNGIFSLLNLSLMDTIYKAKTQSRLALLIVLRHLRQYFKQALRHGN